MRKSLSLMTVGIMLSSVGLTPLGNTVTLLVFVAVLIAGVYSIHKRIKLTVDTINSMINRGHIDYDPEIQRSVNRVAILSLALIILSVIVGVFVWSIYLFLGRSVRFALLLLVSGGALMGYAYYVGGLFYKSLPLRPQ